jgi:hypothetical protein
VKNTDNIEFELDDLTESTIFDFGTIANYRTPDKFMSYSGMVLDGKFKVFPSSSKEIVGDTSLEYDYIGGLAAELTLDGIPTVTESTDSRSFSSAQQFIAANSNEGLYYGYPDAYLNWYTWSFWAKRTAGSRGTVKGFFKNLYNFDNRSDVISSADYAQHIISGHSVDDVSAIISCYCALDQTAYSVSNDTILIDDISLRKLDLSSMLGGVKLNSTSYTITTNVTWSGYGSVVGIFVEMDNIKNPQNYIFAEVYRIGEYDANVMLFKCVNGVGSWLGSTEGELYNSAFSFSIIRNVDTIQVNYSGYPVISPVPITDSIFSGNNYAGVLSTLSDISFNSLTVTL